MGHLALPSDVMKLAYPLWETTLPVSTSFIPDSASSLHYDTQQRELLSNAWLAVRRPATAQPDGLRFYSVALVLN